MITLDGLAGDAFVPLVIADGTGGDVAMVRGGDAIDVTLAVLDDDDVAGVDDDAFDCGDALLLAAPFLDGLVAAASGDAFFAAAVAVASFRGGDAIDGVTLAVLDDDDVAGVDDAAATDCDDDALFAASFSAAIVATAVAFDVMVSSDGRSPSDDGPSSMTTTFFDLLFALLFALLFVFFLTLLHMLPLGQCIYYI